MEEKINIKDYHLFLESVLFDVNTCLMNMRILEIEFLKNNSIVLKEIEFFKNYYNQQKFILIVQFEKIFSNSYNQKFNIHNLIKDLERVDNDEIDKLIEFNYNHSQYKCNDIFRDKDYLSETVEIVKKKLIENELLFSKLKYLRNKVYAHTDKIDLLDEDKDIKTEEFEVLKDLAVEMYNTLLGKLFDRYYHFQFTEKWDVRNLLRNNI